MKHLLDLFIETGLLQFGSFSKNGTIMPFTFHLDLLPSYPDVLQTLAENALSQIHTHHIQRLVAVENTLALGVTLTLTTRIPLVYHQNNRETATTDLVGAFDIGHPALLLISQADEAPEYISLVTHARRVGLDIQNSLAVVDLGIGGEISDLSVRSILNLSEIIPHLVETKRLPVGQGQAVMKWISANHR
jgi:hypothetical protein